MKHVDAVWERRNLGVATTELTIEVQDTAAEIVTVARSMPDGYHVAKVPVARFDIMRTLEHEGFSFIEASIRVVHDLRLQEPAGLFKRMVEAVQYIEVDDSEVDRVGSEIEAGMFRTDRIVLDPAFTAEQAARRYVNWMHDELARGGSLYELRLSGRGVGFFVFRQDASGVGHSVLSGLYSSGQTPGLGSALLHKVLVEAASRGLSRLASYISSNNIAVVKTHIDQGFLISDMFYVYVRHQPDASSHHG